MKLTILILVLTICAIALAHPGKDEKSDKNEKGGKQQSTKKTEASSKSPAKHDEKSDGKKSQKDDGKKGGNGDKADSKSKNGNNAQNKGKPAGPSGGNNNKQQSANRTGPPLPPGCENYANATDGVTAWDCCPALPQAFNHGAMFNRSKDENTGKGNKGGEKNGEKDGGKKEQRGSHGHSENRGRPENHGPHRHHSHEDGDKENFCQKIEKVTAYYNLTGADGVISVDAAVKYLESSSNGSTGYNYQDIVAKCVAQAPADVAAFSEWMKNMTQGGQQHGPGGKGKGPMKECSNSTKLNIAIMRCVRRQLILQCPNWVQSTDCSNLMTFANACPAYPMMGCHKQGGRPDGKDESVGARRAASSKKA